jgi:hypothetical protein
VVAHRIGDALQGPGKIDGRRPRGAERVGRDSDGSARKASARPYAATAPIRGAPRVCIARIACAASSAERNVSVTNSCGNFV